MLARRPRQIAMVVANSDVERASACNKLIASGYDPLGFSDCANASAWLEEETPVLAVVSDDLGADCAELTSTLEERGLKMRPFSGCGLRDVHHLRNLARS